MLCARQLTGENWKRESTTDGFGVLKSGVLPKAYKTTISRHALVPIIDSDTARFEGGLN